METKTTGLARNPLYKDPTAKQNDFFAALKSVGSKVALDLADYSPLVDHLTITTKKLDYDLTHDKDVLNNPYLNSSNTSIKGSLIPKLMHKIFEKFSPLYKVKHTQADANTIQKFRTPDFEYSKLPSISDHKLLFSIRQIIIIQAINELYNPLYRRNNLALSEKSSAGLIKKISDTKKLFEDRIAANVDSKQQFLNQAMRQQGFFAVLAQSGAKAALDAARKIMTPNGLDLISEFNAVLKYIQHVGDAVFTENYETYYNDIPVGAHLLYNFSAGPFQAFHHGIYIGHKTVVEILNYKEGAAVRSFQTVTHITDFINRANGLGNISPILIRTYNNPFPADMIVKRAIWSLGQFPGYNLENENCETVASWIASNSFSQEHYCFSPKTVLSKAMWKRFNVDNNTLDGGRYKTRRNRRQLRQLRQSRQSRQLRE